MNKTANCWPNAEQSLLLKAALIADEDRARSYWLEFCNAVDVQLIDYSTTSMTPLIYKRFRNLQGTEIQVAKSVYKHTWSNNNLSLHALRKVLLAFDQEGIKVTLLKGAAMISNYYHDPGLRVVGDMDILVPKDQAKQAIDLLRNMGWKQLYHIEERKFEYIHATSFVNNKEVNIDLHWRILSDAPFDRSFVQFQPEKRPAEGFLAYTLCPEDQLLHTLLHCHKYSPVPLIRWIPDASILLNQTQDFRWDYFFESVNDLKVQFVIRKALLFLQSEGYINLPEAELKKLSALTWTKPDQKYFDFQTMPRGGYFHLYIYVWRLHCRNNSSTGLLKLFFTLPKFVMNSISVEGYWRLFKYELTRYVKYIISKIRFSVQ